MPSDKKPIAVRLPEEVRAQVKKLAEEYSVSEATIGIWAFKALLDYIKKNNGRVILPIDFNDVIKDSPVKVVKYTPHEEKG